MSLQRKTLSSVRFCLFMAAVILACASCGSNLTGQPSGLTKIIPAIALSTDCAASSPVPAGATRVYIALRNGIDGSGQSASDARDGSAPAAFDTILRCYEDGCSGMRIIPRTENLIVCLGPGTFSTLGNYDAPIDLPHPSPQGFRLGKGWKIHGLGPDQTTLQLSDYLPITNPNNALNFPPGTGAGLVLSTASHRVSGVEISDMTIDMNYAALRQRADQNGTGPLNLEAIHLWSAKGGNWIHNVNVINAAGEIALLDERWETFTVMIVNGIAGSTPLDSTGNLIESLTVSGSGGRKGTAIAISNAGGEVRNSQVTGYEIAFGGWSMGPVRFHDNSAIGTKYGFNIDSLVNSGVRIEANEIAPSQGYGVVIGGAGVYNNMTIAGNTITIGDAQTTGVLFTGDVSHSVVSGNSILAGKSGSGGYAIRNLSINAMAGANANNAYQSNTIDSRLPVIFEAPSLRSMNCAFGNRDEKGNPRGDLPDTSAVPCVP